MDKSHYGPNNTIVFDGYVQSTKDLTHLRRAKGKVGKKKMLSLNNKLTVKKEDLLLNEENKVAFIRMLGEEFANSNIRVKYCEGDADLLVVHTALEVAKHQNVTIIGEDTDLLILLLYHKPTDCHNVYFTSEEKFNAESKPKVTGE